MSCKPDYFYKSRQRKAQKFWDKQPRWVSECAAEYSYIKVESPGFYEGIVVWKNIKIEINFQQCFLILAVL